MLVRSLVFISLISSIAACAAGEDDATGGADALSASAAKPPINAPAPPTALCADSKAWSLPDAAWMAWFSQQSYLHYREFSPELVQAGFGAPGEDVLWKADAARVDQARADDAPNLGEIELGVTRTLHPDRKLEFIGTTSVVDGQVVHGSTQVTLAIHRTLPVVVIVFRGTEPEHMDDIMTDLDTTKLESEETHLPGRVHRGFFQALGDVETLLLERLRGLPPETHVYVTGHSLGGALATILAAKLVHDPSTRRPLSLYTYGSPRVGDDAFATAFADEMSAAGATAVRFHHQADPVVRVPVINYAHVGLPIFLDADRFEVDTPEALAFPSANDHRMAGYRASVERALFQRPPYPLVAKDDAAGTSLATLTTCSH